MNLDWIFGNTNTVPIMIFLVIFIGSSLTLILYGLHQAVNIWRYRRRIRRLNE